MISSELISEKIFKILKGHGYQVEMFTDEGQYTIDPEEGRRYYLPEVFVMINLDENDNKRELKVSVSAGTDMDKTEPLRNQLKNLANSSIIEYTLKQFTKNIEPKDFDFEAQKARDMNTVNEAISAPWGSTKSSYQKLENAKLIIKHKKPVNEESRGARSRNIQAIYIENSDGERYRFPSNNLAGGRAMLRHVKEGGTPYDEWGSHIIEQCKELSKLKEFKRYSEKNSLVNEETDDILEAINTRISEIRNTLHKAKGGRNYGSMKESYLESLNEGWCAICGNDPCSCTDENLTELRDMFTVKRFEETLDDALPYVNKLVSEMQAVRERDNFAQESLTSLIDAIAAADSVELKKGIDLSNDPENPMVNNTVKNAPMQAQLGAVMEYLATVMGGSENDMSVLLSRASDLIDHVDDKAMLSKTAKALVDLLPKLKTTMGEGSEDKPYICVHAKKGKHECHAKSSYEAAKKAAEHWKLKSTAGIDAHLAVEEAVERVLENFDFDKLFS